MQPYLASLVNIIVMKYTRHISAIVDEGAQIGGAPASKHFVYICGCVKIGKGVSLG